MNKKIFGLLMLMVIFNGCSEKPEDRLLSPIDKIDKTAELDKFVIYDNELKVAGMMFYASPDNQIIDFKYNDTSNNKCIRYYWSGREVYDYSSGQWQNGWCGFGLIVGKDWTEVSKTHNLAPYGFNKLKFKIRGGYLTQNVKLKIIGPKNKNDGDIDKKEITNVQLTPDWKQYEINITNNLDDINIYVGIVFENTGTQQSQGGEMFIDDIILVKE